MSTKNCSVCNLQGKKIAPEAWCPECEEFLCSSCNHHHQIQRATGDHRTIPFEDYCKLPPFIISIQLTCEEHKETYQYYCRSHDYPLCKKCISKSHKKCDDTPDIDEVIQNVKTSAVFENIWEDLHAIHLTYLKAIKDREENLDRIKRKKAGLSAEVRERTKSLIDHLKKLEKQALSELDAIMNETANQIKATSKVLKLEERKIKDIIGQKKLIEKHASNFQTFIGIKHMEREVQDSEGILQKLSEKGDMDKTDIEIKVKTSVEDTVFGVKSLGKFCVVRERKIIPIDREISNRDRQVAVEPCFPKQLTLKHQFTLEDGYYTGCCTLPSDIIVLADYKNEKVIIIQSNGSLQSSVSFKGKGTAGVTAINEHHVAVTNYKSQTISIIDVSSSKVIKTLEIKSEVSGITHMDGHLYVCVPKTGLRKVNIETGKLSYVRHDETVDENSHIDTDGNRTCYTCYNKDAVTVLDNNYRVIFIFKNAKILLGPQGTSMDQHQNLFVCNLAKDQLLLISRDGDKHEVVVSREDGLYCPLVVHYDKDTREALLVDQKCVARKF